MRREPIEVSPNCARNQQGPVKEETERMEVKQGKLVMGFRVEQIDSYRKANIARHRGGAVWRDGKFAAV